MNSELYDIEILFKLKQGQDRFQLTVEPSGMGRYIYIYNIYGFPEASRIRITELF